MKQILQYYFNITYFKGHMALQIKCIEPIKKQPEPIYGEHGVPDFKILDKKPEERIKEIFKYRKKIIRRTKIPYEYKRWRVIYKDCS